MPAHSSRILNPATLPPVEQRALECLLERMSRRPFAGATKAEAENHPWPDRLGALQQRYVQVNPKHFLSVLSLDMDKHSVEAAVADAALYRGVKLPWPNFQTMRRGGNFQAHWLVLVPVGRASTHRVAPVAFAEGVHRRLKNNFGADRSSSGYVMRGLYHQDQQTRAFRAEPYSLHELSALLPAVPPEARLVTDVLGRNDTMFRSLDRWAATQVANGASPHTLAFRSLLEREAQALLEQLPGGNHPYTDAELRRTINSVVKRSQHGKNAKYVWRSGIYVPHVPGAALRRRQRSDERSAPLPPAQARANMRAGAQYTNELQTERALAPLVAAARALAAQGLEATVRNMQQELLRAGVRRSERTITKHAAVWRVEAARAAQDQQGTQLGQAAD